MGPPILLTTARFDGPTLVVQADGADERFTLGADPVVPVDGRIQPAPIAVSPDGRTVVTFDGTGAIRVLDAATGRPVGPPITPTDPDLIGYLSATDVAFSPDGRVLAIGGTDGRLQLFDVRTGHLLGGPAPVSTSPIDTVMFSPDRKYVVALDENGTLQRLPVASVFGDPAGQLCSTVGLPDEADWHQYAPNESEPATCAG